MISVVVPTRNNSTDLKYCLDSLAKQSKDVVVVFDSKDDSNIPLAKKYKAKIAFDPYHSIGGAYFTGSNAASGDVIAFTDDDCIVPKNWVKKLEKEFKEGIDIVGGEDILPRNSSFFQKAAYQMDKARILNKPVYGARAKARLKASNIAYKKSMFKKENFNPRLKGLQEPEFHHRLFQRGAKMKYDPNLVVYHKRRSSLGGIFSQIYRNGKAKVELMRLHGNSSMAFYDALIFAFSAFLGVSVSLALAGFVQPLLLGLTLLVTYLLAKPLYYVSKTRELRYYVHLVFIIAVREAAYTIGLWEALPNILKK